MRRSIATVSLSGTLQAKLEAVAAARFDSVEIFENDLLFFDGSARYIHGLASDLGLNISLFQPFRDFEGVDDDRLRRNLDRAERKFDVMQELGTSLLLVCSNVQRDTLRDDDIVVSQLYQLAERAARRGLRIGYEALAWGSHVRTYSHAWQIVQRVAHPCFGLLLDSFHTLALGDDPSGIAQIPGERIFFVQLADAPLLKMDVLSWSRHFRCFPGEGDLQVADFLKQVVLSGYVGPISLEVFNDDFRAASTRQTAIDGMRSLLFLEEQVRNGFEHEEAVTAAGAKRRRRVDLFDAPAVPELTGIAFLEFATESFSEHALSGWLERLGFYAAGRHRTKEVMLLKQGDINLILNAEPDSFAHAYYLMHGQSICAIGLRTSDDLLALSRAEAFFCTRFEGRIGPNEKAIPAIRSLDGSLIYFISNSADTPDPLAVDFIAEATPGRNGPGVGLKAIDHVAQALPDGQLDPWILFYRAVLGLTPQDAWDLPDPYGLVRSRAVASKNGTVCFPLNISESRNTATARSVSTFAGAGVHHIAFSTDDIFEAVVRLQENETPILRIPANYYDDLEARFEISPELANRLRQHNVLYDRSGSGEFFQVYTEAFEDRFFCEIVQRVGGYALYGAANAPARMAAQARSRHGTT
ncbi:MAG: sugar phosphate isomerase/epimerase and 4-hydroxyphenylpyruvate domain-containing protein [Verrucomicrobia bacterium]|nr:sugar phosphate isomerase/epimerase and 4-hydroxyphenylpyruvate domain-containing protein [Verrucomicrobiota bacterium]